jgi:hypothetical protein
LLEPFPRNGAGNQQPELVGIPSNGSETHSTTRTVVVWDTKNTLAKYFVVVYNSTYTINFVGEV